LPPSIDVRFVAPTYSVIAILVFASPLGAQQPLPASDRRTIGSTLDADILKDLPTAGNLFSALETMQAEIVADRFNSGGLNGGAASYVVSLLGSRRQTRYWFGDVEITSAAGGTPLLFPDSALWRRVDVDTAMMPTDLNANGLAVSLDPPRPSERWSGMVEGFGSGGRLVSSPAATRPPPIAQLDSWVRGSAVVSGPVSARARLLAAATVSDSTTVIQRQTDGTPEHARSVFSEFLVSPGEDRDLRTIGWLQWTAHATTVHVQSAYATPNGRPFGWRLFGGYTRQDRDANRAPAIRIVDRLVDGPVTALPRGGAATERRWSVGTRLALASRPHATLGVEYASVAVRSDPVADTIVGETIDGIPARVWLSTSPAIASHRAATTISAVATDRLELSSRVEVDAGVRFESAHGRAQGAIGGIRWYTLLPNVAFRWHVGGRLVRTFFTGYRRSANQLTLDLLEHGDPAAPVSQVYRWNGSLDDRDTLVARVGPGTAGDPGFSVIDAQLRRPQTDEFVIGVDSRITQTWRLEVAGIARRESSLISLVNVGVPPSRYRMFTIADANADLVNPADDQQLPVYERLADSFGHDRYLLTNGDANVATMGAVVITAHAHTGRLFMSIGATAAAVVGPGGNRGFRANENDQDAIGELLINPNASTNARGRLFSDRAYTIKWTTVYKLPADVRVGLIARYQDGQPFSRIVVVPELAQGAEAIQAFANGRSRFAFTGTLDLRLTKGIALGTARLEAVLDIYNLLDLKKEVEEYVVTGPRFRATTAVQPPRAAHVGLRMIF
jgi:hypothetical protein